MPEVLDGIHVTTERKRWIVQANGVTLSRHFSKPAAIATARRLAKRHGEQLVLHLENGTVIETKSYEVSPI